MKHTDKRIVIINGSGGVGKDTFIDFCSEFVKVKNISSVDKVKKAAKILGWNGGKTEVDRKFLSDLKLLSCTYSDHSYNHIKRSIKDFEKGQADLMFIHLRDIPELARVKRDFNCVALLITNDRVAPITTNVGDANVRNFAYDVTIDNSYSLDELKRKAFNFVYELF